jgi:hypothetical protein
VPTRHLVSLSQVENAYGGAKGSDCLHPFCSARFSGAKNGEECKNIEGVRNMALLSFLDRELSVAHPGYSRWLVPPAALAIHLSIGQVYAFSVFKIPLTQPLGVGKSMPDDWKQTQIAWIFSLAIVMLGLSAATFGKWLEGAVPRKAMFASAVCFALGFYISYLGAISHQLWLLYVGYGVVGGMGLGLGYISPGVDSDQVVSGSPRSCQRNGHHGIRRRRHPTADRNAGCATGCPPCGKRPAGTSTVYFELA